MTIKTRIIATLALLFIMMLGISSYGPAVNMIQSASIEDALLEGKIVQIQHLMEKSRSQLALALQHHPRFEFAVLHNHPVENHLKLVQENITEVEKRWNEYSSHIHDPAEKALAEKWFNDTEALGKTHLTTAIEAVRKGDWDAAEHLLIGQVAKNYTAGGIASNELSIHIADRLQKASAKAESQIRIANMALISGVVLAFIVAVFSAITLIRNIIPPLIQAIGVTERISQGDLTQDVVVRNNNEIGRMLSAIRDMNESLRRIVGQVHTDSDAIASATTQIAAGNLDLSSRTEEQAASLEETASSVEEMTQTVRMNTEKATQANTLANDASRIATEAGSVVSDVVDTMTVINESSHRIVDIISVIDGIAFQTNILALNAAVEAARAGEQGRGFAVVATEVRSLAQRSASAAREIKELIDDSVEKTEHGTTLVNRAGEIMSRVVNSIQEVNALMGEITTASREQADGIEQINIAVTQMDQATQQNAALVEEAAAAAQTLSENAENLKRMVGIFQLPGAASASGRKPPLALGYDSMEG